MIFTSPQTRMVIMRGISGSGKSTLARELAKSDPKRWAIVSRDTIREDMLGKEDLERYFKQGLNMAVEETVTAEEHKRIVSALAQGKSVIIDNTNLKPKYIIAFVKLALDMGVSTDDILIHECDTPSIDEAYERIQKRGERFVGKQIIQSQADQLRSYPSPSLYDKYVKKEIRNYRPKKWFLPSFEVEKYTPNPACTPAIICDLDGTLSHRALLKEPYIHYRSFYEYGKCDTDLVDPLVADVLVALYFHGYQIIFVSGRKNDCYQETVDFIKRAIGLDREQYTLLMRDPEIDVHQERGVTMDDHDDNVKYRLFNENLRENTNIVGVIDDRKRVVALWEALGIRVMNVGLLNEEF